MIEGHYPNTRAIHYSNRDFEYLRPFYEEAYPFIDLEITDPRLPTKLQRLENELEELKMQRNILSREKSNLAENRGGITPEEVTERVHAIYPRVIHQLRPDLRPLPPELQEQLKKHLLGIND